MTRAGIIAVAAGIFLAGGVCAEDINPLMGKAGDFVIREADLERLISNQPLETQKKLQNDSEQRSNLVRQILLTKAIAIRAKKEGFDRKPEVKEQLSYLIDTYIAQEYLQKVVLANTTVPEEELKKYYQEHVQDFIVPVTVRVRHIFVKAPVEATVESKVKGKEKIEGLLQKLKKGADFADIAKDFSEDEDSAANGGDLGYLSPGKTNSESFEKIVFALKSGEVSNIIETPFGYHIVKCDERKEQRSASIDEVREFLTKKLKGESEQKKAQEFFDKIAKDAGLEVFIGKSVIPEINATEPIHQKK